MDDSAWKFKFFEPNVRSARYINWKKEQYVVSQKEKRSSLRRSQQLLKWKAHCIQNGFINQINLDFDPLAAFHWPRFAILCWSQKLRQNRATKKLCKRHQDARPLNPSRTPMILHAIVWRVWTQSTKEMYCFWTITEHRCILTRSRLCLWDSTK